MFHNAAYEGQAFISNSIDSTSYLSLPGILEEHGHWGLDSSFLLQSSSTPFYLEILTLVGNSFQPLQYKQHR